MLIVQKALLVYIVVVSSISVRLLHIVCQASICYCHMREYPLFPAFYFFNLLPVLLLFSLHDVLSLKIFERRGTSSSALNQNILITFFDQLLQHLLLCLLTAQKSLGYH